MLWALRSAIALIVLAPMVACGRYQYEKGPVPKTERAPCPGRFCGRSSLNDTHFSGCGPCPKGSRVENNTYSICEECDTVLDTNDLFYLSFQALLVLVLHWMAIDLTAKRRTFTKEVLIVHSCAFFEVVIASLVSLWVMGLFSPMSTVFCKPRELKDWYPYFFHPNPNYEGTLYCTQEIVYPLYTIVFLFYLMCDVVMIIVRPYVVMKLIPRRGKNSIYMALWFMPALALIHATLGGLVYISYPYIILVLSIISSAGHFAFKLDQSFKALLLGSVFDCRNLIILLGHWLLHAFGIMAITQIENQTLHLFLLVVVPLPSAVYILTAQCTDPVNFTEDNTT